MARKQVRLSININKVATLRNSRDKDNPHVLKTALDLVKMGAEGITVHPRPDERHIRRSDVYELAACLGDVEFNIEGYPSDDFIEMIEEIEPDQATLVPDKPNALTSNAGWRTKGNEQFLQHVISRLNKTGTRISVFVDPFAITEGELRQLREWGAHRIELYTERYADDFDGPEALFTLRKYQECAAQASRLGLGINAGHDLNSINLRAFADAIPELEEVSIGHAFICDALYLGYQTTLEIYLEQLRPQLLA